MMVFVSWYVGKPSSSPPIGYSNVPTHSPSSERRSAEASPCVGSRVLLLQKYTMLPVPTTDKRGMPPGT